jgi:hypothetical protein
MFFDLSYIDNFNNNIFIVLNFLDGMSTFSNLFKFTLNGNLVATQYYSFRIDDIEPISSYKLYASTTQGVFNINPNDLSDYSQIKSGYPSELVFPSNEGKVYSTSYFNSQLVVFDVTTDETTSIDLDLPFHILEGTYNPINKKVYLSIYCFENLTSRLLIVSTENNSILEEFDLGYFWGALIWEEMNGSDNRLYFSDSDKLYFIPGNQNSVTSDIDQYDGKTRKIGYNPDLNQVVTLKTDKAYFLINNSSLNSILDLNTTGGWCETSTYDPINNKIYITDNISINEKLSLSIYDGSDFSLISTLGSDFSPKNIHYSNVSEKTYLLTDDAKIKVINGENNTVDETLLIGSNHSLDILTSKDDKLFTASYSPIKISYFNLQNNIRKDLNIPNGKPTKLVFGEPEYIYVNSGIEIQPRYLYRIHILDNIEWTIYRDDNNFLIYSPVDKTVFIQKDNSIAKIDGILGTQLDNLNLGSNIIIDGIYNPKDNTMIIIVENDSYNYLWKINCDDLSFYIEPILIQKGIYNNIFINDLNNRIYLYLAVDYTDFKTKLLTFDLDNMQQLGLIDLGPQRSLTDEMYWSVPKDIKPSLNRNTNQIIIPNYIYSNFSVVQCPEEERTFRNGWNWVSFPKLERENDDPVDLAPLLNTMEPMPNQMLVQHRLNTENNPMTWAEYIHPNNWTFDQLEDLQSTKGYKIEITDGEDEFQLTTPGTRLAPDYPFMLAGDMVENWIGYYEYQQADPFDALAYCIDNLRVIKGQHWSAYWEVIYIDKGSPVYGWFMSKPYPLKYGDMLIVQGINDCELIWNQSPKAGGKEKAEAIYFDYQEQADYTSVFIELDQDSDATEIGAFVGGSCVGATVVEEGDSLVEIQAYLQGAEGDEMYFETHSTNKSKPAAVADYFVKDFNTMQYVNRKIRPYDKKPFHLVSFKDHTEEMADAFVVYHYPNPAIDQLNLHFNLPEETSVSIQLIDVNGKVLDENDLGNYPLGSHDYNFTLPADLSSGVYLYKLITNKTTIVNQLVIQ